MSESSRALSEADAAAVAAAAVRQQSLAVWLFDFSTFSINWANPEGLNFWNAASIEELAARDLRAEMSGSVRARLSQYCVDLKADHDRVFRESWTLYPNDVPVLVECTFRWCPRPDGGPATLVEGRPLEDRDPVTVRSLDALLHSQVMTALYSVSGTLLYANRALRAAMGPEYGTFGSGFADLEVGPRFLAKVLAEGSHRETAQVQTVTGSRWYHFQAMRCRDSATGAPAFHISATDVTAMQLTEQQLREARDKARSADRAKSEFVASLSHEMRTPMNGIMGLVELLRRSDLTDAQARQLEALRDSGFALLHLIEDVLDISSVELGAMKLNPVQVDLRKIARSVVEGLRPPAQDKGLTLLLEVDQELPEIAVCDGPRLAQLMRNLIGNAIKFTTEGWVLLSLSLDADSRLRVEVTDTGPGVPEGVRDQAFEKFNRANRSSSGPQGGLGLGLAICREIVELCRGEIGVDEAPGGGALFWIRLPVTFPDTLVEDTPRVVPALSMDSRAWLNSLDLSGSR
ncbi:MAG: ATP-binding protein [Pseudomonadota bacterium]